MQAQPDLFAFARATAAPAPPEPAWIAPPVDLRLLALIEAEGRSPFGSEEHDDAQVQGMADETMNGLVWELGAVADLERRHRAGRVAFRNERAWRDFEDRYPERHQMHMECYGATLDAVLELWGFKGRDAFDREARRRAAR